MFVEAAGGSGVGEKHPLRAIEDEHGVRQGIERGSDHVTAGAIGTGEGCYEVEGSRLFESIRYRTFRRKPGTTHVSFILPIGPDPLQVRSAADNRRFDAI